MSKLGTTPVYVWCNACSHEWHVFISLGEDGVGGPSHVCSSHSFGKHDMGITSTWKHEDYDRLWPDGWELVWLGDASHEEILEATKTAYELNQIAAKAAAGEREGTPSHQPPPGPPEP